MASTVFNVDIGRHTVRVEDEGCGREPLMVTIRGEHDYTAHTSDPNELRRLAKALNSVADFFEERCI